MKDKKPKRQRIEDLLEQLTNKSKYKYSFYFYKSIIDNNNYSYPSCKSALIRELRNHNIPYDDRSEFGLRFTMELPHLLKENDELYFNMVYSLFVSNIKYSVFDDTYLVTIEIK